MFMGFLRTCDKIAGSISGIVGYLSGIFMILLILNVFYDVIMRYAFKNSTIFMQEMEWHLFSALFLFGMSYALKHEGHVRVDVFYDRFSEKHKALVNVIGTILFLIPFALIIIINSQDFVMYSYEISEKSQDPGGIPYRFAIKTLVPFAFLLLVIQSIGFLSKNLLVFLDSDKSENSKNQGENA